MNAYYWTRLIIEGGSFAITIITITLTFTFSDSGQEDKRLSVAW
jgi:hypothetical protein